MRFIFILLFFMTAVLFTACVSEDDEIPGTDESGQLTDADQTIEIPEAENNNTPTEESTSPDIDNNAPVDDNPPVDDNNPPDETEIPEEDPNAAWLEANQYGTTGGDSGKALAADSEDNIFLAGITIGNLDGNTCQMGDDFQCSQDIFLSKWSTKGTKLWTKQWGSKSTEVVYDMVIDSNDDLYIAGITSGELSDQSCVKDEEGVCTGDIFVTKLDKNGDEIWTKQWGSDEIEGASRIVLDHEENIIISGASRGSIEDTPNTGGDTCRSVPDGYRETGGLQCYDSYIAKLSPDGERIWAKMWGTEYWDDTRGIAVDADGNIYVTGVTGVPQTDENGTVIAVDVQSYVAKLDTNGEIVWEEVFGTDEDDYAGDVTVDNDNNVIVCGKTKGTLPGETAIKEYDLFVMKFDNDGTELWTTQYGSDKNEEANNIMMGSDGFIYVGGQTKGSIGGSANAGFFPASNDPFVSKFDSDGNMIWTKLNGTNQNDMTGNMVLNSNNDIFLAGETYAAYPGLVSAGGRDIFLLYFPAD